MFMGTSEQLRPLTGPGSIIQGPFNASFMAEPAKRPGASVQPAEQLRPLTGPGAIIAGPVTSATTQTPPRPMSPSPSPSIVEYQTTPTGYNPASLSVGTPDTPVLQSQLTTNVPESKSSTIPPGLIMSALAFIASKL